ncbi:hypothetical protein LCGC14_0176220 [marine sediment metagenome]|uniref:Uncharacterized protein n=1 Tax=marine sediment metagenome TaxID=412755 RepID=A0A0F9XTW6_9ZZZZ
MNEEELKEQTRLYLQRKMDNYQAKNSPDPEQNECTKCFLTEQMHIKHPINTCANFTKERN